MAWWAFGHVEKKILEYDVTGLYHKIEYDIAMERSV